MKKTLSINRIFRIWAVVMCFVIFKAKQTSLQGQTQTNLSDVDKESDLPPSNADFKEFIELAQEVYEYRKDRLPDFDTWSKMAEEPNTIILDGRSKEAFDKFHVKGAINFDFSDFSAPKLAKVIPNKDTRILIYCNNNFFDAPSWNESEEVESVEKVVVSEPQVLAGALGAPGPTKEHIKGPAGRTPNSMKNAEGEYIQGPAGPAPNPTSSTEEYMERAAPVQGPQGMTTSSTSSSKGEVKGTSLPAGNSGPIGNSGVGPVGPKGPVGPSSTVKIRAAHPSVPPGAKGPPGPLGIKGKGKAKGKAKGKKKEKKSKKWNWNPDNPNGSPLALNIPIYINLYYYGYKNLYELGESVPVNHPDLEVEGTYKK